MEIQSVEVQSVEVARNGAAVETQDELTLDRVPIGSKAVVGAVQSTNALLRNKLLMMGLVRNAHIEVLNIAPLGDPMTIRVLGSKLSLRLSEARSISVMRA